ncbi:hypothetical protein XELAEV_18026525mg [Xenopus laevis]|uniref:Uncharacterized protein n=1 Tax=Xenopus laevis TaxID=8355 RepID=A0A974CVR6_XENLA|nr:hypothetical protein XELAEV_18026525mg [Xenopus laevis]
MHVKACPTTLVTLWQSYPGNSLPGKVLHYSLGDKESVPFPNKSTNGPVSTIFPSTFPDGQGTGSHVAGTQTACDTIETLLDLFPFLYSPQADSPKGSNTELAGSHRAETGIHSNENLYPRNAALMNP